MQAVSSVTPSLGPPGCLMQAMRPLAHLLPPPLSPCPCSSLTASLCWGPPAGLSGQFFYQSRVFQDDSQLPSRQTSWPAGNVMHWLASLHTPSHPHPQGSSSHSHLCGTSPNSRRFTQLSQKLLGFHSNLLPA